MIIDLALLALEGKTGHIEPDDRYTSGYKVVADDANGQHTPMLPWEERWAIMKWLTDRGWGQAVQPVAVEAILRDATSSERAVLPGSLTFEALRQIQSALRLPAATEHDPASPSSDAPARSSSSSSEREPDAVDAELVGDGETEG